LEGKRGWQIHTDYAKGKGAVHLNHWIANIKCESCPVHEKQNALLIAAAPEMFEALNEAANMIAILLSDDGRLINAPAIETMNKIDRVIAKADGIL